MEDCKEGLRGTTYRLMEQEPDKERNLRKRELDMEKYLHRLESEIKRTMRS